MNHSQNNQAEFFQKIGGHKSDNKSIYIEDDFVGFVLFVMSNYMSSRFKYRVVMSATISASTRCSICLEFYLVCRDSCL